MAFCGKCGAKIDEGVKFCPSCGAMVSEKGSVQKEVKEESRLIYESKGRGKSSLIIIAVSILFIVFAFVFWSIIDFSIGDIGNAKMLGGYGDNSVIIEALAGFVFIGLGVCYLKVGLFIAICWVKIYTDHIEAYAYGGKMVNLRYNQINSVQIQGTMVNIISGSDKIKLLCDNNKKVYDLINKMIAK